MLLESSKVALAVAESAILLQVQVLTQHLQKKKNPLTQRFIERSKANKMEGKFESRFECGERKK